MLRIINSLTPFFEGCYRRINVREYARIMKISPPTASKVLSYYNSKNIILKQEYRNYLFFYANKESKDFIDLSRIYWRGKLGEVSAYLENGLITPTIILFGSLSKAETKKDSDIDLAIFAHKRKINLEKFEKKLNRKIQVFWFKSLKDIRNKELVNNIINGYVLTGRLPL